MVEILYQLPVFVLAAAIVFYLPGSLLRQALPWKPADGLTEFALRLGLGVLVIPVVYQWLRRANVPDPGMLAVLMLLLAGSVFAFRRTRWAAHWAEWSRDDAAALLCGMLFTLLLLGLSHFRDFGISAAGSWYKTSLLTESTFHQGLVNYLKDGYPPPALYAAGSGDFSSYHLNMHLQIEAISRLTGIGTDRLVFWYFPLLYFLLLFLLPVAFVRRHGGGIVPAVVAGMLVFGTGFSFIPGLLGLADSSFAWVQFFHADIYGLFTLNGVIPGLLALFTVMLLFPLRGEHHNLWYWGLMVLVMLAAYGFKSSMGTQIAGAWLAVAGLRLLFDGSREPRCWIMAACGALALGLMLLDQFLWRSGLGESHLEFRPWYPLDMMLRQLGLPADDNSWKPAWFLLFMLAGLGVRVLGLLSFKSTLTARPESIWLAWFILVFLVCGYILADTLYLGDGTYQFNHATWFAVQGLFASWFLLFLWLARMDPGSTRTGAMLVALIALSLPSTAQLLSLKADSGIAHIGRDEMEVVAYLETIDPESIVMHPLNIGQPSLASNLAGRSSVLNVFKSFVNRSHGLEQRVHGVQLFFDPATDEETRQAIMDFYGVTHVYGPRQSDSVLAQTRRLERVLANEKYSIWKVNLKAQPTEL